MAASALLVPAISMFFQGIGHRKEENAPEPFTGPVNAITRIFAEQFYKFPMFVLSGEFLAEWKRNGA